MKGKFLLFFVFCMSALTLCTHTPLISPIPIVVIPSDTSTIPHTGIPCSADTAYFTDVLPLFISYCTYSGCHEAGTDQSGYQLTDYANIVHKGLSKGNPGGSSVYTAMSRGRMPPGISMSASQLALIQKWIAQGALNNSCNTNYYGVCDTSSVSFSADVMPLVQNSCVGCHNSSRAGNGISLTNYTQVKASVVSGRFYGSIAQIPGYYSMPKGSFKFSACQLNKIKAWINRGALDN